jgi:hypothetical protein
MYACNFKQECCFVSDVDFANHVCFRGAFMFLKPSLSEVSVIYELPFDTSVWVTYTISVVILTVVLMLTRRVYQHVNPSASSDSHIGWGDSIMDSLAIVCQQGETDADFGFYEFFISMCSLYWYRCYLIYCIKLFYCTKILKHTHR